VVVINYIQEVDVSIVQEIWMQRKTEQAMVAPSANLVTKIDEGCGCFHAILDDPNCPASLPYEQPAIRCEGNPDGFIPVASNTFLKKAGRECG
jgi:hypothetical protein